MKEEEVYLISLWDKYKEERPSVVVVVVVGVGVDGGDGGGGGVGDRRLNMETRSKWFTFICI